ncbi:hypothetical protein [Hoeflea sp.]|uniref:hypothetical protein n=1 Tax=Hoeflea sp. TaxID=1940281 RepID=UPI002AFE62D1|nr:hypothetical protein [Hoeflea sp.]
MTSTEQADPAHTFKTNRTAAIMMTIAAAVTLMLLRPELSLVYLAYTGISVYSLSWARTRGYVGKPCPVRQQNMAAYVSISTVGFMATLFGAPHLFEPIASVIFIVFAAVMAILALYTIFDRK